MTLTFNKVALPAERIAACVDAITSHVLDGSYARWRYGEGNPVGARQLEGLSDEQKALWAEPTRSEAGGGSQGVGLEVAKIAGSTIAQCHEAMVASGVSLEQIRIEVKLLVSGGHLCSTIDDHYKAI